MLLPLTGKVTELGEWRFRNNGEEQIIPFAKVFVQVGTKTDLVTVPIAKTDQVKAGDQVAWAVEVTLKKNAQGVARLGVRKV